MRTLLALTFALFTIPGITPAIAANIGEPIPHTLSVMDQNGEPQSFDALKGEKGAVIVFVSSVDWCPYCQAQLIDLGKRSAEIKEKGYNIIAISYDSIESQKKFSDKYGFKYTLLSDEGSEIIKAFGILNEEMKEGSSYYGVPHPAIYVVGADGTILNILKEEGYKARPPVEDILEKIELR
jgi:peroxiredoxin